MLSIQKAKESEINTFPYECCDINKPRVGDWVLIFDRVGNPSDQLAEVTKLYEYHCGVVFRDGESWSAAYQNVRVIIPVEAIAR